MIYLYGFTLCDNSFETQIINHQISLKKKIQYIVKLSKNNEYDKIVKILVVKAKEETRIINLYICIKYHSKNTKTCEF